MSELTDLNATGNGLAVVSGGLQGLLEAYKMKMAQNVEQAKISQQGLDAGAQARMMMPYQMLMAGQAQDRLDEQSAHNRATEATAAVNAGNPQASAAIMARDTLNGSFDPATVPKRGAIFSNYILELDKQSQGNPQLLAAAEAAKSKMFEANQTAQRVQRSGEALVPLVAALKKSIGFNEQTGQYDGPTDQSNIPMWNKIKQGTADAMGSATYTPTRTNALAIQKELNMMAANGGSDKNLSMAQEMIKPTSSPAQLQAGIKTLEGMVGGRSAAYGGSNPFTPPPAPTIHPVLAAALSGAAPAPAAPSATNYSDPNKAAQIAAAYKSGPQTPEAYAATKQQLDALTVGGQ